MSLTFALNHKPVTVELESINLTLLQWLRRTGLTGSKEGCAEGDCGACSVAMLDTNARAEPTWRAVNSCLMPLASLAGREIVTVEGVAEGGTLHPVQASMVRHHGSQCGYCTPGFICSLFEGWHRRDLTTQEQLDDQLCGNLCRCTGYRAIQDAACEALQHRSEAGAHLQRLQSPAPALTRINDTTPLGKFLRPTDLSGLFDAIDDCGGLSDAVKLVAGATELGLEITKRYCEFDALISLEAVEELQRLRQTDRGWEIGAAVTLTRIEEALAAEYPPMASMLRWFGSRQIRNRATMGGNLVTASPIGDSAPVLLALDARLVLVSRAGRRELPIAEFFTDYRRTALKSGEILEAILLPPMAPSDGLTRSSEFLKVSKRREMDISAVAAAFVVDVDVENRVRHARLAFGGVATIPKRACGAEAALMGMEWSQETVESIALVLPGEFTPITDARGSATYRADLIPGLWRKFFHDRNAEGRDAGHIRPVAPFAAPPPPHESAALHVTGRAHYVDDAPVSASELAVWPVMSPHAHARIVRRDAGAARSMPGIHAVLLAEDVPGINDVGAVRQDEPLFAREEVLYHGHLVALVVGKSEGACRAAAEKVIVEYEPLPAILTIQAAEEANNFHTDANFIRRGDVGAALASSPLRFSGDLEMGGQEHFYLESHAARAEMHDDGSVFVSSSTQHPTEIQAVVSHVLGISRNQVTVESPRMGGGFGGKETQGNTPAALAALAAWKTGRPVRVRFNRDHDMILTGKRHPFLARFEASHDADGNLLAVRAELIANGGWSLDLSMAICDRALFHSDNGYYIPAMEVSGRVAKANLASNTAFRGFGGPQGMLVIEEIIDRVARRCRLDPAVVRERNLYRGRGETNTTHYGQEIGDERLGRIWRELKADASLVERRVEMAVWNAASPWHKRGLAITPVKFGISFTHTLLNQAGAMVLMYVDGSVQVNHGGTEMGQGLHTKIQAIAAAELGLTMDRVKVMATRTDKVPNTSATAASSGSDLNGAAVANACATLRERLARVAAAMLDAEGHEASVVFADNKAGIDGRAVDTSAVAKQAWMSRISLAASGFYATPGIAWDRVTGTGRPFHYFACGAAVSEVEVDGFTGQMRLRRVDILHDIGRPINEGVDRGQVEGGFIQGMGWLTCEELVWNAEGRLLTHSPDTYKIPAFGDAPKDFRVRFLTDAAQDEVIRGSKAVGEPPLMLAISVREAIRDAVGAFGPGGVEIPLAAPSTGEAILAAINGQRQLKAQGVAAVAASSTNR